MVLGFGVKVSVFLGFLRQGLSSLQAGVCTLPRSWASRELGLNRVPPPPGPAPRPLSGDPGCHLWSLRQGVASRGHQLSPPSVFAQPGWPGSLSGGATFPLQFRQWRARRGLPLSVPGRGPSWPWCPPPSPGDLSPVPSEAQSGTGHSTDCPRSRGLSRANHLLLGIQFAYHLTYSGAHY